MDGKEFFEKGQRLFLQRKFKESRMMFNKALEEGFEPVTAHLSIGASFMNEADYDQAMQEFSKAIETDKDNDRAYYYRGVAYLN